MNDGDSRQRILFLTTPHTYRLAAFRQAAERLGVEMVVAVDLPPALAAEQPEALGIDFADRPAAVTRLLAYAQDHPLEAVIAVDDSGALLAAEVSDALGLPHNAPTAADAARNKLRMRQLLQAGGVPSPQFQPFGLGADPAAVAAQIPYPAVLKPVDLSGSRGVVRVDSPAAFVAAHGRLKAMLTGRYGGDDQTQYLVEAYIPGIEVALEGILDDGRLHTLALFDKPDPLDGPYFEETIYVTPSRLPAADQAAVRATAAQAAAALGLRTGPVHAEQRVNDRGPWIVEIAGRSIGGLCSQTLRFGLDVSLEELIVRQACGLPFLDLVREDEANGVMMIPIPAAGLLRRVDGEAAARQVPLVESVDITAKLNYPLVPLPEGESYLGFIFARGDDPAAVEAALREAHQKLKFEIDDLLPVVN